MIIDKNVLQVQAETTDDKNLFALVKEQIKKEEVENLVIQLF